LSPIACLFSIPVSLLSIIPASAGVWLGSSTSYNSHQMFNNWNKLSHSVLTQLLRSFVAPYFTYESSTCHKTPLEIPNASISSPVADAEAKTLSYLQATMKKQLPLSRVVKRDKSPLFLSAPKIFSVTLGVKWTNIELAFWQLKMWCGTWLSYKNGVTIDWSKTFAFYLFRLLLKNCPWPVLLLYSSFSAAFLSFISYPFLRSF
jgi:hypothetical protein